MIIFRGTLQKYSATQDFHRILRYIVVVVDAIIKLQYTSLVNPLKIADEVQTTVSTLDNEKSVCILEKLRIALRKISDLANGTNLQQWLF